MHVYETTPPPSLPLSWDEKNTYLPDLWDIFFTTSQNPIYYPRIFFSLILVFAPVCFPIHFACAQTDPVHSLLYDSLASQPNKGLRIPDQRPAQVPDPRNHSKQVPLWHVILIGGFDSDPTKKQIKGSARRGRGSSGLYQLHRDLESMGTASRYFNWEGSDAGRLGRSGAPGPARIANYVRQFHLKNSRLKTAIIGASWGGYTALEVTEVLNSTENVIPVETLILVDASAFFRNLKGLPPISKNVMHAINYFTHNRISTGALTDVRVENIDLGNSINGFLRNHWARYNRRGDWRAHVLSQWDPYIHQDIHNRMARWPPFSVQSNR